ncbi:hypothetical protein ACB094_08G034700 [Castanea mollissima]
MGTAFGGGFTILYEAVKKVIGQAIMFKSVLEDLSATLESLESLVKEISRLNVVLDLPEKEIERLAKLMQKGAKMVDKCSKIQQCNIFSKAYYALKIKELNDAIEKFCKVDLQAQIGRTTLLTLAGVNDIRKHMNNLNLMRVGLRTLSVSRPRDDIVGLVLPLKELKMELKKKEEQVLLLTGLGGCGKTTLVKMLRWDDEIKGIYGGNIFFVNVSKHPNLKVIVQDLYSRAHEFPNDEDAINQLEQHLNQIASNESNKSNPILMILDDVWPESKSTIDKFTFNIPDYKIVVTSRTAFPKFKSTYNLKPLDHEDAMSLFCRSASVNDMSFYVSKEKIEMIVRGCGGLPIALKVIGASLCGRPAEVWKSTLKRWSDDGHSIFQSDKEVLVCLKKSLEFSDEKSILKEYFMDLGSFPEDQRIPATALIDMWTEIHEPNQNDDHVTADLHELTTRNLASLVKTRKDVSAVSNYYNEAFVTQHDVLRDLAIHLSSQDPITERERFIVDIRGNKLPEWWMKQEQLLINARLLSISTDELFSSRWCNIQAPKVEALVLNFQTGNYTLPEFLEKMVELKVIIITNYGFFPAELSNFQLLKSLPYLKRIRLEKVSIPSLCNAPVPLRSVKKISLFMCNIGQAFGNSTIQVSDSLPSLKEINIDYCNDLVELPTWLCDFLSLERLSITNCHKLFALPEGIGNLVNLKVLRFTACTELSELPESIKSLHKLCILDISDCLSITKLPKHIGELHHLQELHMKKCLRLCKQLPTSIVDLKQLELVVCDEERAKLWEPIREIFSGLNVMVAKEDISLDWLQK